MDQATASMTTNPSAELASGEAFELDFAIDFADAELTAEEKALIPKELSIEDDADEEIEASLDVEADPETEAEADEVPTNRVLPMVQHVVARGFKALDSDDRPTLKAALDGGMSADYNEATDEYFIEWPRVDNKPTDFIRVGKSQQHPGRYEVDFTTAPAYNKNGITVDADVKGRNGAAPQALATAFPKDESTLATLIGRLVRMVHQKREIESMVGEGLVEGVTENIKSLLRPNSSLPVRYTADHQHDKPVTAHFFPVSDRGNSTHLGVVVAKPGNGVVVMNTAVRASFLVHKIGKAADKLKVGDPVQIRYALDKRLDAGVSVTPVDVHTIATHQESINSQKKGRPLEDRRELVFQSGADFPLPKLVETPLDPRPVAAKAPARARDLGR